MEGETKTVDIHSWHFIGGRFGQFGEGLTAKPKLGVSVPGKEPVVNVKYCHNATVA